MTINNDTSGRFHSRKHPRMKHYDYSTPNYYFITICTHEKMCIFSDSGNLNAYGKLAESGILQIGKHFQNVKVDKYVVMPNHIHAILILEGEGASLPTIIGQYKSYVSKMIRKAEPEKNIWQASFHDHVIRNQQAYEKIWLYIDSNPQNWNNDCFFTQR